MPIPAFRPEDFRAESGGIVRATRRPPGWSAPGPKPALSTALPGDPRVEQTLWPSAEEDLCWLAGDYRILQRLDGHRWSLDDLMTAWVAATCGLSPSTLCDLGCGIGTVLLFNAWTFPRATLVGVEAQAESAAMARRSIAWNDVSDRVRVLDGDIRTTALDTYDLVTGTPPYFPAGTGIQSSRPQCAPCRFEHRGGVEVYIDAMAKCLAPNGRAILCQGATQTMRVRPAVEQAGLHVHDQIDVIPREGKPVLVSIYTLGREPAAQPTQRSMCVRLRDGKWTDDFRAVRDRLGMPPGRHDA